MNVSFLSMPLLRAWRSLLSLALVAVGLSASSALAAGEVRLLKAFSAVGSRYGMSWQDTSFTLVVQNIAYEKQVAIHMRDVSGQWIDLPASYVGPAEDGFEVWKVQHQFPTSVPTRDLEFVAKYTVNGQTYWDNNNSQNYFLGRNDGPLLNGPHVLVNSAFLRADGTLDVTVDLRNIAYAKSVTLVYTTNEGQTWHHVPASYVSGYTYGYAYITSPNAQGVERWSVSTNTGAQRVRFGVRYDVNGTYYWDTNFGWNYVVVP
ncbi:carbohydrate-binding protein [Myxococcaceae bacterium GXIMD 01537]